MRTVCVSVVVFVSLSAWAGKKTVVVAGGDCADASLISGAKDFRDAVARLLGPQLIEGEGVLDIVRPRPTRSLQDLERQIDSAKALFYGGQADRAEQLVDRALEELERASPEAKPWEVTQSALVLKALIAKNLDRPRDMSDAFRRIVRIAPGFQLDPDAHPPSALAALDAVKKELGRARKAPVLIRTETGPAATVFIDGQPLGTTPLKVDLVPGSYRVALVANGMVSFPHRLDVPKDSKLSVDFAFEGSISTQAPLCLAGGSESSAVKLAQLVAAENVIVLRNTARRGEPPYLSGTLTDLAAGKQRDGSVAPELLANLATFLVTGRDVAGVQRAVPPVAPTKPPEPEPAKVVAVADAPRAPPVEASPAVEARQPTFDLKPGTPAGRVASFTLIGLGAASVLGGLIAWVSIDDVRSRLAGLTLNDTIPSQATSAGAEALQKMKIVDANNALSFGLIGGGVGAIVAGVVGTTLFPASTTQVSIGPTPSGASMQVQGRF